MTFAKEIQKVRKNKAQQKFSNWHDHTSVISYAEMLEKENERLKVLLQKAEKVLKWYADEDNYTYRIFKAHILEGEIQNRIIIKNTGQKARDYLKEKQ